MDALRDERPAGTLGITDAIALSIAGIGLLATWSVQLFAVPHFASMFRDFGAELPDVTLAALAPWIAGLGTLATALLAGVGVVVRVARGGWAGTSVTIAAAAVPIATVLVIVYALYLPVVQLSGAIAP